MNGYQIEKIMRRDPNTSRPFLGCFPSDNIPSKPRYKNLYPYCAVINTDVSSEPGEHWVAIYVPDDEHVEYFDSFALPPNDFIADYLRQFQHVTTSKLTLQSIRSTVCGRYVIYFLCNRCTGKSFRESENNLYLYRDYKSHPNNVVTAFVARCFDDELI